MYYALNYIKISKKNILWKLVIYYNNDEILFDNNFISGFLVFD